MPQLFSLAHLSLLALPPPELIAVAAGAGYGAVGLRLLPSVPDGVAYPLMDDPALLRETLARSNATGVAVFDLEVVRLNAEFNVASHLAFFEAGARLGAAGGRERRRRTVKSSPAPVSSRAARGRPASPARRHGAAVPSSPARTCAPVR